MAAYQCLNCGQIEKDDCCENPDMFCINDMCEEIKRLRAELARSAIAAADQWLGKPETDRAQRMRDAGHTSRPTTMGDPIRAACVENLDDGSYTDPTDRDVERLQAQGVGPTDTLLAALIAIESAFAQKCADTWCTSRNAETLETARAAIAAAGGKVSRNTEPER